MCRFSCAMLLVVACLGSSLAVKRKRLTSKRPAASSASVPTLPLPSLGTATAIVPPTEPLAPLVTESGSTEALPPLATENDVAIPLTPAARASAFLHYPAQEDAPRPQLGPQVGVLENTLELMRDNNRLLYLLLSRQHIDNVNMNLCISYMENVMEQQADLHRWILDHIGMLVRFEAAVGQTLSSSSGDAPANNSGGRA